MSGKGWKIVLLLVLAAAAGYLWWRPIQAERALESASREELQEITARRPGYARAFYYLGLKWWREGQRGPAFDALARAADLDSDDEKIWVAAAGASNGVNGPQAAFRIMGDFLQRHPRSAKMRLQRASLLGSLRRAAEGFADGKRYEEAIRYYKIWLAESPGDSDARQGLVTTLLASGDKEAAFRALDRAVQENPQFAEARVALAEMFFEAGFTAAARKHLEEAVKTAPNHARAWHTLGRVSGGADPQRAETAFQRAADLLPDNPHALLDLAAVQTTNQKPEQAEANFRRALKLAPNDPVVLSRVSGFLLDTHPTPERRAEAASLARQATALDPKRGDAYYHLGRAALEGRSAKEAVGDLEKALTLPLAEDEVTIWYTLSRAYMQSGDRARADAALRKSRQIREDRFALARAEEEAYTKPQDPALRLKVARLYVQHGEYVKAISQYQGCISLSPANVEARRELESLTARLKAHGKLPSMTLFEAMVEASTR